MFPAKKLHILLVDHYTIGSNSSKAVATLANAMARRGHHVAIMSQKPVPKALYPLYRLCHKIKTLSLPAGKRATAPLGVKKMEDLYTLESSVKIIPYSFTDKNLKIQKLRAKIKALDPDVCIGPFDDEKHLAWAVTLLGSGVPYIYSETIPPSIFDNVYWNRKGRLAAMSGADAIHVPLPSCRQSIPDFLIDRVAIIPNSIEEPAGIAPAENRAGPNVLLCMWRHLEEVNYCCVAIDAFAKLADKFPDWELHIACNGPDKDLIQKHASANNLGKRIKFLDDINNPSCILPGAQAFCLMSWLGSQPQELMEAMAAGLPCVAFREWVGVEDIIADGKTGLLVDGMNADALAVRLGELMANPNLRETLGHNARTAMKTCASEAVFDAWEKLLAQTAIKKGHTVMDSFRQEPFASMARLASRAGMECMWHEFGDPAFPVKAYCRLFLGKAKNFILSKLPGSGKVVKS